MTATKNLLGVEMADLDRIKPRWKGVYALQNWRDAATTAREFQLAEDDPIRAARYLLDWCGRVLAADLTTADQKTVSGWKAKAFELLRRQR